MYVRVEKNNLAYDDAGQGLPVLFIHGYPLSRRIWEAQVKGLAENARILALDLPGHGESSPQPGPYWMGDLADECAQFMEIVGVKRSYVACGLSMGGYVTLALYRQHAAHLAGLILASTKATADTPEGKAGRDRAAALASEKGVKAVVETMLPRLMASSTYQTRPKLVAKVEQIMLETSLDGVLGDLIGMRERPDSTGTLAEIQLPVLIIHGADDQLIQLKEAEAMQAAIPHSRLEVIRGAGHLPCLEQPERFNLAVSAFLSDIL